MRLDRVLNFRPAGTRQVLLVLGCGVLAVNLFAAAALALVFAAPSQQERTPAPKPSASPSAAPSATPQRATTTPAERTIRAVLGQPPKNLFDGDWAVQPLRDAVLGAPLPKTCLRALGAAAPAFGVSRQASGGGAGATSQLWAYPAGQGAAAVDRMREILDSCSRTGMALSVDSSPVEDAGGFTAVGSGGGQQVAWAVWHRGDVVGAVSLTRFDSGSRSEARSLARTLDYRLVPALKGVCADLSSSAADATRNPYAVGKGYQPYLAVRQVPPLPRPDDPDPEGAPSVPVTLPKPRPFPELAPPVLPPATQWLDTNRDGKRETPPPMATATKGAVPTLVDPAAVAIPGALVRERPTRPDRPETPASTSSVMVPAVDTRGPGCGWGFAGGKPPVFDAALVQRQSGQAVVKGLVDQTAAQAAYQVAMARWVSASEDYAQARESYEAYQQLAQARQKAQASLDAARKAHAAAVARYTAALKAAADSLKKPTPTTSAPTTPPPPSTTTAGPPATPAPARTP